MWQQLISSHCAHIDNTARRKERSSVKWGETRLDIEDAVRHRGLTCNKIAETIGRSVEHTRKVLQAMVSEGELQTARNGAGGAAPFIYSLPEVVNVH